MNCTGRFAPSPTGPPHFGSLMAALASFLDSRSQGGRWLLRIEDLDPPREVPGASDNIIRTLAHYGLEWDDQVLFQSDRLSIYRKNLDALISQGLAYPCSCTRSEMKRRDALALYDGHCRTHTPRPGTQCAVRALYPAEDVQFHDRIQGNRLYPGQDGRGDFVIFRRDQLFAYQLAVVVDDAYQRVDQVVRGFDLIDETPRQIVLQKHLGLVTPSYAHIPVATNAEGQKLSKQTYAPALSDSDQDRSRNLYFALEILGQNPPAALREEAAQTILEWGVSNWHIEAVPRQPGVRPKEWS